MAQSAMRRLIGLPTPQTAGSTALAAAVMRGVV
jgi:hypothetical protein